jgi:Baseplate J-like protein
VSPTDGEPQLLYLEPDDEITSVIRRLRGADVGRVVLVAPGRSRATSSVVALRLLARAAAETGRSVALVADASTRALAGEAGVAAFASVADATSGTPSPAEPITQTRAPIHVVRGAAIPRAQAAKPPPATDGLDETMAVHLPPPTNRGASGRPRRRSRFPLWPFLVVLLVLAVAIGAALLPGATVHIRPATTPVTPQSFPVETAVIGHLTQELQAAKDGTATGERLDQVAATGGVSFTNWSLVSVEVPQGTQVSVGGTTAFTTVKRIVVPRGKFNGRAIQPGQASVAVIAVDLGPAGNVAAGAIDTVDSPTVRAFLRGSPDNPNRLVTNTEPTTGGVETTHPVIKQEDVDAAVAAVKADLRQQLDALLAQDSDRIYADAPETETPSVEVPPELVGKEDTPTFELSGNLNINRAYASRAEVVDTASAGLPTPVGKTIVSDSVVVVVQSAADQGESMLIQVSVTAEAAAVIDKAAVRDLVAGKTVEEARTALADLGEIVVDLWPPWVDRLPDLSFRIYVLEEVKTDSSGGSPQESVN